MRYPKKPMKIEMVHIINFFIFNISQPRLFLNLFFQEPTVCIFICGLKVNVNNAETKENPANTLNVLDSPKDFKHSTTINGRLIVKNAPPRFIKPFANPSIIQ